ncbi:MAG: Cell wall-associated hydrolase, NlpC family [Blastococcus sp.]|nr:Cell wall-associated hydrolase, NlpC family [Blastococcus sp.]
MDSGTRSTPVRGIRRTTATRTTHGAVPPAPRLLAAAVLALLALGLTPAVAEAAPRPNDTQIAQAQTKADAVAARIGALSQEMAVAEDRVDAARGAAVIALDGYQAMQAAYQAAEAEAAAAAAAAAQATAELGVARTEVVAFARRSYMDGSTYPGAAALITASGPAELIERAALLEAAGSHRADVLVRVAVVQEQATQADAAARTAVDTAAGLQETAATALEVAKSAEISARQQAAALTAQQAALQTDLAAAQTQLRSLVGARAAAERTAQVVRPAVTAPPKAPVAPAPVGNSVSAGAGDASAASRAIAAAMVYRGTPYAWGGGGTRGPGPGQDPDVGVIGFDCSGLTQYAYARAGISIQRNSRAQYAGLPKVSSDDLRPGDLVFWANDPSDPDTIRHVAIYLGGNEILEAPQSGDVVKVSDMRWKGYIGAARPSA